MILKSRYLLLFLLGLLVGGLLTSFTNNNTLHLTSPFTKKSAEASGLTFTGEIEELETADDVVSATADDVIVNSNNNKEVKPSVLNECDLHRDDTTLADSLFQQIRILCLVFTYPANHRIKAVRVMETWGKRCNKLLFVTSEDEELPTIGLNITDGREYLGKKTRAALDHAFANYLHDFDWFMKADDDSYVIMENLRYFLSAQDPKVPVFFGQAFMRYIKQGYPQGGAGYVFSREALKVYGEKSSGNIGCIFYTGFEDVDFGLCMQHLGVTFGDSLDSLGRTRFHCFDISTHANGKYDSAYPDWDKHKGKHKRIEDMSDYAISFHYVKPDYMYVMEYLIYNLNPYGILKGLQDLNNPNNTVTLNSNSLSQSAEEARQEKKEDHTPPS